MDEARVVSSVDPLPALPSPSQFTLKKKEVKITKHYAKRFGNLAIVERRARMLEMNAHGLNGLQLCEELGAELNVPAKTLRRDWCRRKQWISDVLHLNDAEATVQNILVEFREARRMSQTAGSQALGDGTGMTAVAAAKTTAEILKAEVDFLQSIGVITKQPEQLVMTMMNLRGKMVPKSEAEKPNSPTPAEPAAADSRV